MKRDREWTVEVFSPVEIYLCNSMRARSGPWIWDSEGWTLRDSTGDYDDMLVSEALQDNIENALKEGVDLPATFAYRSEDLRRA